MATVIAKKAARSFAPQATSGWASLVKPLGGFDHGAGFGGDLARHRLDRGGRFAPVPWLTCAGEIGLAALHVELLGSTQGALVGILSFGFLPLRLIDRCEETPAAGVTCLFVARWLLRSVSASANSPPAEGECGAGKHRHLRRLGIAAVELVGFRDRSRSGSRSLTSGSLAEIGRLEAGLGVGVRVQSRSRYCFEFRRRRGGG